MAMGGAGPGLCPDRRRCARIPPNDPRIVNSGDEAHAAPTAGTGARTSISKGRGRGAPYVPLSLWLSFVSDVTEWAMALI